ncbi:protein-glutamine glutaminase family protein [Amycolatopsis sp. NPDC051061]|uniref:protein-glutamine glutaminase family protein n=1 Tax=Amycolatopsis sp. NPDC051061 TaxID=3155042 RepID=UPI00342106BE
MYAAPINEVRRAGPVWDLVRAWILDMAGVVNPSTGRAVTGPEVQRLSGFQLPPKWATDVWRGAKRQAAVTASSSASAATGSANAAQGPQKLWEGHFAGRFSTVVDPADLDLLVGQVAAVLAEQRSRRDAERTSVDLRLVLSIAESGGKLLQTVLPRLLSAHAQVLGKLAEAGASDVKITKVLLTSRPGNVRLELVRRLDGGGVPLAQYRDRTSLVLTLLGNTNELPEVEADLVRLVAAGAARRAQGAALPAFVFEVGQVRGDTEQAHGEREAHFRRLVGEGLDDGHSAPGPVPEVKVRYQGAARHGEIPVRLSLGDPAGADTGEVWSTSLQSAQEGIYAHEQAPLDAWLDRAAQESLERRDADRPPVDFRITAHHHPVKTAAEKATLDAASNHVVQHVSRGFAAALAPWPGSPHAGPAVLELTFPVGDRPLTKAETEAGNYRTGILLTVHPDAHPGWTAADYRNARELTGLAFVEGSTKLTDASAWQVEQVVSGAVARATANALAAGDRTAAVEPITLVPVRIARDPAALGEARREHLAAWVRELVREAAAEAAKTVAGQGGITLRPPAVTVTASEVQPKGHPVARIVIGMSGPAVEPARQEGNALQRRRQAEYRARRRRLAAGKALENWWQEPGQIGLQWRGALTLPEADLRALIHWVDAVFPLLRTRETAGIEPLHIEVVHYRQRSETPTDRRRIADDDRQRVGNLLAEAAQRAGHPGLSGGHPARFVSAVVRAHHGHSSGLEVWLRRDPGGSIAGYRAARVLDLVFEPDEVALAPVVEWRLRWMLGDVAQRVRAGGERPEPVTVSIRLVSGPGAKADRGSHTAELNRLLVDVFGDALGDRVVVDLQVHVVPEWPRKLTAGSVVVGDGRASAVSRGVAVPGPSRLVVPPWHGELTVVPRRKRPREQLRTARRLEERSPAEVSLARQELTELKAFTQAIATQWKAVRGKVGMPDVRIRLSQPRSLVRYEDDTLDFVVGQLREWLGEYGVDASGWRFHEFIYLSPSIIIPRASVTVQPTPLLTGEQIAAVPRWEGNFLGKSAANETNSVMRPEMNELSPAMEWQLSTWLKAAVGTVVGATDKPLLLVELVARTTKQFQQRVGSVRSAAAAVLRSMPRGPQDADAFIDAHFRFYVDTDWDAPGVDLRLSVIPAHHVPAVEAMVAGNPLWVVEEPADAPALVLDDVPGEPAAPDTRPDSPAVPAAEDAGPARPEETGPEQPVAEGSFDVDEFMADFDPSWASGGFDPSFGDAPAFEPDPGAFDALNAFFGDQGVFEFEPGAGLAGFEFDLPVWTGPADAGFAEPAAGGSGVSPRRRGTAQDVMRRHRGLSRPGYDPDGVRFEPLGSAGGFEVTGVRSGVVVGDRASAVAGAAQWFPRRDGEFDLVLIEHGVRDVQAVMETLRTAGWDRVDALRVWASNVDFLAEFVRDLRAAAGVPVFRPVGLLYVGFEEPQGWSSRVGRVGSVRYHVDGTPFFAEAEAGGWVEVLPGGEEHPAAFDEPFPADAPARYDLDEVVQLAPANGRSQQAESARARGRRHSRADRTVSPDEDFVPMPPPDPAPASAAGSAVEAPRDGDPLADETWRHSLAASAGWFAPLADPLRPAGWEHLRAGADVRTVDTELADPKVRAELGPDGRRLRLDRYVHLVRYDVRRIEVRPSRFVQEYTVRLRLDASAVTGDEQRTIEAQVRAGLDALGVTSGLRVPGGDQLHVRVEFVGADEPAHAGVVLLGAADPRQSHQTRWNARDGQALAHEVLHFLGLVDEVLDENRVFLRWTGLSRVTTDDGPMGSAVHKGAVVKPRHAWLLERTMVGQLGPVAGWNPLPATPALRDLTGADGPWLGGEDLVPVADGPYAQRLRDQLAGPGPVDFREVLNILRQANVRRDGAVFAAAFAQVAGTGLATALEHAQETGRLTEEQAHRVLDRFRPTAGAHLDPAEAPPVPRIWTDTGEDLPDLPGVQRFAAVVADWIATEAAGDALALLDRLDRNQRALWAVAGAYRQVTVRDGGEPRDLEADLRAALPEESDYLDHVFAHPAPDVAAWRNWAAPTAVEWDAALEWMRELRALTLDLRDRSLPVPHEYTDGGCYLRAHLGTLKLKQLGADTRAIFVADENGIAPPSTEFGDFDGEIDWLYHIAPLVYVRRSGAPEWMVFDPSVAELPLTQAEWFSRLGVPLSQPLFEGSLETVSALMTVLRAQADLWGPDGYVKEPYAVVTDSHAPPDLVSIDEIPAYRSLRDWDSSLRAEESQLVRHTEIAARRKLAGRVRDHVTGLYVHADASGTVVTEDQLFAAVRSILAGSPDRAGLLDDVPRFGEYLRQILPNRHAELDALLAAPDDGGFVPMPPRPGAPGEAFDGAGDAAGALAFAAGPGELAHWKEATHEWTGRFDRNRQLRGADDAALADLARAFAGRLLELARDGREGLDIRLTGYGGAAWERAAVQELADRFRLLIDAELRALQDGEPRYTADSTALAVTVAVFAAGTDRRVELWTHPGPGRRIADHRTAETLDVDYAHRSALLPVAHANRVRWAVQGAAVRAIRAGLRPLPPVLVAVRGQINEVAAAHAERAAGFTALVRQALTETVAEGAARGVADLPSVEELMPQLHLTSDGDYSFRAGQASATVTLPSIPEPEPGPGPRAGSADAEMADARSTPEAELVPLPAATGAPRHGSGGTAARTDPVVRRWAVELPGDGPLRLAPEDQASLGALVDLVGRNTALLLEHDGDLPDVRFALHDTAARRQAHGPTLFALLEDEFRSGLEDRDVTAPELAFDHVEDGRQRGRAAGLEVTVHRAPHSSRHAYRAARTFNAAYSPRAAALPHAARRRLDLLLAGLVERIRDTDDTDGAGDPPRLLLDLRSSAGLIAARTDELTAWVNAALRALLGQDTALTAERVIRDHIAFRHETSVKHAELFADITGPEHELDRTSPEPGVRVDWTDGADPPAPAPARRVPEAGPAPELPPVGTLTRTDAGRVMRRNDPVLGQWTSTLEPGGGLPGAARAELDRFADGFAREVAERAKRGEQLPDVRLSVRAGHRSGHGHLTDEHRRLRDVLLAAVAARGAVPPGLEFTLLTEQVPATGAPVTLRVTVHETPRLTAAEHRAAQQSTAFFLPQLPVLPQAARRRAAWIVQGFVERLLAEPDSGQQLRIAVVHPSPVNHETRTREVRELVEAASTEVLAGHPDVETARRVAALLPDAVRFERYVHRGTPAAVLLDVSDPETSGRVVGHFRTAGRRGLLVFEPDRVAFTEFGRQQGREVVARPELELPDLRIAVRSRITAHDAGARAALTADLLGFLHDGMRAAGVDDATLDRLPVTWSWYEGSGGGYDGEVVFAAIAALRRAPGWYGDARRLTAGFLTHSVRLPVVAERRLGWALAGFFARLADSELAPTLAITVEGPAGVLPGRLARVEALVRAALTGHPGLPPVATILRDHVRISPAPQGKNGPGLRLVESGPEAPSPVALGHQEQGQRAGEKAGHEASDTVMPDAFPEPARPRGASVFDDLERLLEEDFDPQWTAPVPFADLEPDGFLPADDPALDALMDDLIDFDAGQGPDFPAQVPDPVVRGRFTEQGGPVLSTAEAAAVAARFAGLVTEGHRTFEVQLDLNAPEARHDQMAAVVEGAFRRSVDNVLAGGGFPVGSTAEVEISWNGDRESDPERTDFGGWELRFRAVPQQAAPEEGPADWNTLHDLTPEPGDRATPRRAEPDPAASSSGQIGPVAQPPTAVPATGVEPGSVGQPVAVPAAESDLARYLRLSGSPVRLAGQLTGPPALTPQETARLAGLGREVTELVGNGHRAFDVLFTLHGPARLRAHQEQLSTLVGTALRGEVDRLLRGGGFPVDSVESLTFTVRLQFIARAPRGDHGKWELRMQPTDPRPEAAGERVRRIEEQAAVLARAEAERHNRRMAERDAERWRAEQDRRETDWWDRETERHQNQQNDQTRRDAERARIEQEARRQAGQTAEREARAAQARTHGERQATGRAEQQTRPTPTEAPGIPARPPSVVLAHGPADTSRGPNPDLLLPPRASGISADDVLDRVDAGVDQATGMQHGIEVHIGGSQPADTVPLEDLLGPEQAARPSRRGIRTSRTATSGRRRAVSATASRPSDASPTQVEPGDVEHVVLRDRGGAVVGVGFTLSDRERGVLRDAFGNGAGAAGEFGVALHHDEHGFLVRTRGGRVVRLDERGVVRLLTGLRLPGALTWPALVFLSCRVGDRLGTLRELLRHSRFRGKVRGHRTRVEVRRDGTVRPAPDDAAPDDDSVILGPPPAMSGPWRDMTSAALGSRRHYVVDAARPRLADPAAAVDLRTLAAALSSAVRSQQAAGLPVPRVRVVGDRRDARIVADLLRAALDPGRPTPEIGIAPGAPGPVTVDVTVPVVPRRAEHAPTANAAGGISFYAGATSERAAWGRLHHALPSKTGKAEPFFVYVTGRGGKFLVGGALIDGATLARHVRNSPVFRRHAADPSVPVHLAGADPADPDGTIAAAQEFAEALRGDGPYRTVTALTERLTLDAAGRAVPEHDGVVEPVASIRPDDVRWLPLADTHGRRFGMGFASPARRDDGLAGKLSHTTEHSLRAVLEADADAEEHPEPATQAWAAATEGTRTRPVELFLDVHGDDFLVPLSDGSTWRLDAERSAQLLAQSSAFRRLTAGPARPPLIVFGTLPPEAAATAGEAVQRLLAELRALTGHWETYHHTGPYSVGDTAMVTVPRGTRFTEGPPPSTADVVHVAGGGVFGFPVPGGTREPAAETAVLTAFLDAVADGTADLDGLWAPKKPIVVAVDSPDGRFARLATRSGAVLEVDGRRLGEMLLADPRFRRRLAADPLRPVVLVARDDSTLAGFGGLGFDFAGALRSAGFFPDVHAPDGPAVLEPDRIGTGGTTGFLLVSDLRAGDVRTEVLPGADGAPVALFVRYPGDRRAVRLARHWARHATAERLRTHATGTGSADSPWPAGSVPLFLFGGAGPRGYTAIRKDGVHLQLTPATLARIVRTDVRVRRALGRGSGERDDRSLVLAALTGATTGVPEFTQSLLPGGFSRAVHHVPDGFSLFENGTFATNGTEFATEPAPLPGPDDAVTYAMANETLGTHGQFFPLNEIDAQDMYLPARYDSAVRQQYYLRRFANRENGGSRFEPLVAPWAGSTVPAWFLDGHVSPRGWMPFALKTDRSLHIGDTVLLTAEAGARLVAGTELFRRAGLDPWASIQLGQCWTMAPQSGTGRTHAERFKLEWRRIVGPGAVFGATRGVIVDTSTAVRVVEDGGTIVEALPEHERTPEVPLADLAASRIRPEVLTFASKSKTLPGPAVAVVRRVAQQVVRAAAWRRRNHAGLPEVTIRGFGQVGLLSGGKQAKETGRARADAVAAVFRHELEEEALRLARLGLEVRPGDLAVRVLGAEAPPQTGPVARLEVRLPQHELGERAVRRVAGGDRSEKAVQELNGAFRALAPGKVPNPAPAPAGTGAVAIRHAGAPDAGHGPISEPGETGAAATPPARPVTVAEVRSRLERMAEAGAGGRGRHELLGPELFGFGRTPGAPAALRGLDHNRLSAAQGMTTGAASARPAHPEEAAALPEAPGHDPDEDVPMTDVDEGSDRDADGETDPDYDSDRDAEGESDPEYARPDVPALFGQLSDEIAQLRRHLAAFPAAYQPELRDRVRDWSRRVSLLRAVALSDVDALDLADRLAGARRLAARLRELRLQQLGRTYAAAVTEAEDDENPLTSHPGGVPGGVSSRPDARFGFEIEFQLFGEEFADAEAALRPKLDAAGFRDWTIVREGAHKGGVEVVSPILRGPARSWADLAKVLAIIHAHRGPDGGRPDASYVGGHVNFSFVEQPELPVYGRVAQLNKAFEGLLYRLGNHYGTTALQRKLWMVGPNPLPPDPATITSADEVQALSTGKPDAINFQHIDGDAGDWLEFRFWAGTLDVSVWQVHAEISAAMVLAAKDPSLHRRLDELMADPRLLGHEPAAATWEAELGLLLDFLELLPLSPAAQELAVQLYAWTAPWSEQGGNDHHLRAQVVIGPGARGWVYPVRGDSVRDALRTVRSLPAYDGVEIVAATVTPGRDTVELWSTDPVPFAAFGKVLAACEVLINAVDAAPDDAELRLVLAVPGGAARLGPAVLAEVAAPVVVTHGGVRITGDGRVEAGSEWIELSRTGAAVHTGRTDLGEALEWLSRPETRTPPVRPRFGGGPSGAPLLTLTGDQAPAAPGTPPPPATPAPAPVPAHEVTADDVRWFAARNAEGRETVLSVSDGDEQAGYLAGTFKWTTEQSDRLYGLNRTDTSGEVTAVEVTADWADGPNPVRLLLSAAGGRFFAPLRDGRHAMLTPGEMAERVAASAQFRQLTAGPVRPPLAVITYADGVPPGDHSLNEAFLARLAELTGPWLSYHYAGPLSLREDGVLVVDHPFAAGPPLVPADVRYHRDGARTVFAGTAEVFAGEGEALVVAVPGTETSARVELVNGERTDLGGTALGELLLRDPGFRPQLAHGRPVVLDTGAADVRVGPGGLGFDFAGALRAAGFFDDVHVRAADGTLTLVSVPRAGDLRTTEITGPAEQPIGEFVRFPGDGDVLARVRRWAAKDAGALTAFLAGDGTWALTPWQRRPVLLFARRSETGYRALRRDGRELDLTAGELGRSLRDGRELRGMLGTKGAVAGEEGQETGIVLASLGGPVTGLAELADEFVPAGYSRTWYGSAGELEFRPDGVLGVGGGFERAAPIVPQPRHLAGYERANAKLGTRGQYFPARDFDRALMAAGAVNDTTAQSRIYYSGTTEPDGEGGQHEVWRPYLTPVRPDATRSWAAVLHGTPGRGFHFRLLAGSPHRLGDRVTLAGAPSAAALFGSAAFRRAGPAGPVELTLLSCLADVHPGPGRPSSAFLLKQAWDHGRPLRVLAPDGFAALVADGARYVSDGGHLREVFGPDATPPEPIPLSDLAAGRIEQADVLGPGADSTEVGRAARQVARAAAWRSRLGAPRPAVEIVGYGDTVGRGRERAEEVAGVFRAEFAAESARLAALDLPVAAPAPVAITAGVFADVPGGWLPADVVVYTDLPVHELGEGALATGDPEEIRRAFAALDPETD